VVWAGRWCRGHGRLRVAGVADALIKHRDGIVGNWLGATLNPLLRALDNPANLQDWEPWVRGAVIDFDLLSHLHVTKHNESFSYTDPITGATVNKTSNRSVTVWHMNITNTGPGKSPKATSSPGLNKCPSRPRSQSSMCSWSRSACFRCQCRRCQ
jgi:hypothetical protein